MDREPLPFYLQACITAMKFNRNAVSAVLVLRFSPVTIIKQ